MRPHTCKFLYGLSLPALVHCSACAPGCQGAALENAASIAAMILSTEALITDLPEKEKPAAPAMPEY